MGIFPHSPILPFLITHLTLVPSVPLDSFASTFM